jgi:hypothetical protein
LVCVIADDHQSILQGEWYIRRATTGEKSPFSPIDPDFGEQEAQSGENAWLRQLSKEAAKIGIGERHL